MNCALCNGTILEARGRIEFETKSLGKILTPAIKYMECSSCAQKLIDPIESHKIISYVRAKERELINALPVGDFLSANEAAKYLGITKQAFSKNPKIKSGVVYCAEIGKKKFYSKKSLEAFKGTGNGKFLLPIPCSSRTLESRPIQAKLAMREQGQATKYFTIALGDSESANNDSPPIAYAANF